MTADKPTVPDGVTVIVLADNRAIGTASDFEPGSSAGWHPREAQERRARDAAWARAFKATCRTEVADCIGRSANIERSLRASLGRHHGWRECVIVHGHDGEESE